MANFFLLASCSLVSELEPTSKGGGKPTKKKEIGQKDELKTGRGRRRGFCTKVFLPFFLEVFKKKKRTAAATPIVSAASPFRSLSTVASVFFLLVFRRFFFVTVHNGNGSSRSVTLAVVAIFIWFSGFPPVSCLFFFVELFNRVFFPGFELFLHQVSRRLLLGFTEFFPGYRLNGVFPRNKRKTGQWSCCFFCFSIATKNQAVGLVRCFFVFFCFFLYFHSSPPGAHWNSLQVRPPIFPSIPPHPSRKRQISKRSEYKKKGPKEERERERERVRVHDRMRQKKSER